VFCHHIGVGFRYFGYFSSPELCWGTCVVLDAVGVVLLSLYSCKLQIVAIGLYEEMLLHVEIE